MRSLKIPIFLLLLTVECVHAQVQNILAKVGNLSVTEEEFLLRFELTPGFSQRKQSQLETDKLEFLYSLIAEKLLAQEAQDCQFDRDSLLQHAFGEIRKLIVRDELYRQEISQKVSVTAKDIQQGIKRALDERLVEFLYFSRKEDAEFVRSKIKTARDIARFQIDSTIEVMKDTATVIWGEANEAIEEAAYALKTGQVSKVLQDGPGFYILRLKKSRTSPHFASLKPGTLRDRVSETIRLRKERRRLNEFVPTALKGDTAYARSAMVRALSAEMVKLTGGTTGQNIVFDIDLHRQASDILRSSRNDTVLVAGERVWLTGEILDRLLSTKFEITAGDTKKTFSRLSQQMRIFAQQELLAQEGLRRGLDKLYTVQKKLDMWYQAYLAELMKDYVKRAIVPTEAEVWTALNASDPSVNIPKVRIRELHTFSLDSMKLALAALGEGESFETVVKRWSVDSVSAGRDGVRDPFPMNERPPIGEIAWHMNVGERFGPVSNGNTHIYFELLEKESPVMFHDSSFADRFQKEKKKILLGQYRQTMNKLLAQIGAERGFSVFEERVKQLKVTPIPMMTFRILGFGGRMFEVPFLEKQVEWLETEPPGVKIIP